ncbi:sigma-70 family RNA polymerase sigma factor [Georgenia sp. TF02-10]|uniref:RNA polymerase sigma factor n=1 Tax=Georgenia sp. TF02-10 TaxID=2917725 RepID=UPI001FA7B70F|nr:sigma-70 family RNA polymerase sigma factor [Georgenia sp. TF02-10]UNX54718.1 sigma-70 family RNA polymerase sigma factor [Georgenia sp. TF02-10]
MSDEDRFEDLYRRHRPDVERFVRRRVPPAQVEDVVADTFLVVWRRLDDAPDSPRPWLFGIARRTILSTTRSHGRWEALRVRIASEPHLVDGELASEVASRADLLRAWRRLNDGEREVLSLVAWDGLSVREAAIVLGCQPGTYRVRLLRARRHLLHILEHIPLTDFIPAVPLSEGAQ